MAGVEPTSLDLQVRALPFTYALSISVINRRNRRTRSTGVIRPIAAARRRSQGNTKVARVQSQRLFV
jgi:hypothetical protein